MTYHKLKKLYETIIQNKYNELPIDSINIAINLNIKVKTSLQYKQDFSEDEENPFDNCNALYAIYNGEYTIYYNEEYTYKNFSIAHEIAHHILGHINEGVIQHHDANLLGAIIIAPEKLILQSGIKSAAELSFKCKIPIDVAKAYWSHIPKEILHINKFKQIYNNYKSLAISSFFIILAFIVCFSLYLNNNNSNAYTTNLNNLYEGDITYSTAAPTIIPSAAPIINNDKNTILDNNAVFVTKYGQKYHKQDCSHLKNSTQIFKIPINEAIENGYEACKDCF